MGCGASSSRKNLQAFDAVEPPDPAPSPVSQRQRRKEGTEQAAVVDSPMKMPGVVNAPLPAAPVTIADNKPAPVGTDAPSARETNKAFMRAVKDGNNEKVTQLISQGADIHKRGMWDNTPLINACHYGHEEVATTLLNQGADVHAVNEHGCTALLHVCVESMSGVLPLLISKGANVNPPAASVYNKHTDSTNLRTPLQSAAESGFLQGLQPLLAEGALLQPPPPSTPGANDSSSADAPRPDPPLLLAVRQGHAAVCQQLLAAGASASTTDADGHSVLHVAAARGHEAVVQTLAQHDADLCKQDRSALLVACEKGLSGAARILVEGGASVQMTAADGSTPLHYAGKRGSAPLVTLLLKMGASPSTQDHAGHTPVDLARRGKHDVVALFGVEQ